MSLEERVQQLDQRIADLVQQAVRDFHQEIGRRLSEEVLQRLEKGPTGLPESFLSEEGLQPLAEEAAASGSFQALTGLRDALATLDEARSQADILNALLEESRRFASRAALFLTRPDGASGWGSHGFGDKQIRGMAVDYRDGGPWSRLAQGRSCIEVEAEDGAALVEGLEAPAGSGGLLVPLVLRDRVAAALFADQVDDGPAPQLEALQVLIYAASLAIETLPFRNRGKTPTLIPEDEPTATDAGLGLWDTGSVTAAAKAAQESTPPPPAEAAPGPVEVTPPAAGPLLEDVEQVEVEEVEATAEPVVEPSTPAEPSPEEEARDTQAEGLSVEQVRQQAEVEVGEFVVEDVAEDDDTTVTDAAAEVEEGAPPPDGSLSWEEEPESEAAPALETAPAMEAPSLAWEPEAADAPALEAEATPEEARETQVPSLDADPADTVLLPRDLPTAAAQEADLAVEEATPEAPPAVEAPPVTEAPPAAKKGGRGLFGGGGAGGGPVQVAPPEDIDDQPGRAFGEEEEESPAASADDEADHEKARRLARLLVSEIKLYNEEQVEEGRRSGNIYGALKEDIDRSRQMYEERTDERVRNSTDYFHQELVRLLAGGDANALGL